MITFEEFADAYAAAVPKILAKMKYLERIGRDPFDENKSLSKWRHKVNNLKERRKQNRINKIPFDYDRRKLRLFRDCETAERGRV